VIVRFSFGKQQKDRHMELTQALFGITAAISLPIFKPAY
jgi:hypothetical protein